MLPPEAQYIDYTVKTLKTIAFIAGKKIQQSKNFIFVFPLKISLKTSVCMHQVGLN